MTRLPRATSVFRCAVKPELKRCRPRLVSSSEASIKASFSTSISRWTDGSSFAPGPKRVADSRKVQFPGAINSHFTEKMDIVSASTPLPTYRVTDTNGEIIDKDHEPDVTKEFAQKIYKDMLTLNIMDTVLYEAQRQGRISFYMTHYGEEAQIGSAAALAHDDEVFGQYREAGVLVYRGFTLDEFMNQCYSNDRDLGKGRQMPIHYGTAKLHFQTISSPLGTQLPQAAGAAYAIKRSGRPNCVMCYFGEGAASEGDFHAALNIASTTECPVIFYCRNNGFAISTPSNEQYKGDGIASRGVGYGMHTIRVDGNDVWAVYNAVKAARKIAVEQHKPVLIEAMTYRISHHSTSDDSSAYRSKKEVENWAAKDNPVVRFRKYLENKGWWSAELEAAHKKTTRAAVLTAFNAAEKRPKPPIEELFEDVYDVMPQHLKDQKKELANLMQKYPENFSTVGYAADKKTTTVT